MSPRYPGGKSALCEDIKRATEKAMKENLPLVDISMETRRHVIIARGTEEIYQGHPTTLLMPDGKTIFCVWTYDHGGPCGPMAHSDDAGKTWIRMDDRLPKGFQRHRNHPALTTVADSHGRPL